MTLIRKIKVYETRRKGGSGGAERSGDRKIRNLATDDTVQVEIAKTAGG
jgi:hypothetical protein